MTASKTTTLKLDPKDHWMANHLRSFTGEHLYQFIGSAIQERAKRLVEEGVIDEIPRIPDFVQKDS